jgi:hypothetical protein
MGLLEGITQVKEKHKIFYAQGFGGVNCTKMWSIFSPATYVKEWENRLEDMEFH